MTNKIINVDDKINGSCTVHNYIVPSLSIAVSFYVKCFSVTNGKAVVFISQNCAVQINEGLDD